MTAFCTTSDNKAQYIKSISVFLKPKPTPASAESVIVVAEDEETELESIIDPVGLLIFGKDMNDEQRVSLFTDMTEKLFVQSQLENDQAKLAVISMQIIELIPAAGF